MTRKEIIDFCEMKSQLEPENEDIFNYIIKALEQQHCEDCTSRQALLEEIRAEISKYGSINVAYAITDDTKTDKGIEKLVSDVLKQAKEQVLDIIGKHNLAQESCEFSEDESALDEIYTDIQELRGCSCYCSDGIIDDVEDIIDKYKVRIKNDA